MSFGERLTWCSITNFDIPNTPLDLSNRICSPIRGNYIHFISRESLSYADRSAGIVMSLKVPMAFSVPQRVQARELTSAPLVG